MKIQITKVPKNTANKMAIGGTLQSHGADWSDGTRVIGAGGSHEDNPNQGVQVGVDPEGRPNLVEEGEIIYNDYVYSNRISLDDEAKERLHLPKGTDLTYAEAARKLEREAVERPNDPLSKAALKANMEKLAEEQERQKAEMQAKEAQEAFAQLSPEEQVAIMQQVSAQQEGQPSLEEEAMEQEPMQEEDMGQPQMFPEEMAMMQQQAAMQQGGMPMGAPQTPMMPQMGAYGGETNRFDMGGEVDNSEQANPKKPINVFEWLRKNHPEVGKYYVAIGQAMIKRARAKANRQMYSYLWDRNNNMDTFDYALMWNRSFPGFLGYGEEKAFKNWIQAGLDKEIAFKLMFGERPKGYWSQSPSVRTWEAKHNKYVGKTVAAPSKGSSQPEPVYGNQFDWVRAKHPDWSDELINRVGDAMVVRYWHNKKEYAVNNNDKGRMAFNYQKAYDDVHDEVVKELQKEAPKLLNQYLGEKNVETTPSQSTPASATYKGSGKDAQGTYSLVVNKDRNTGKFVFNKKKTNGTKAQNQRKQAVIKASNNSAPPYDRAMKIKQPPIDIDTMNNIQEIVNNPNLGDAEKQARISEIMFPLFMGKQKEYDPINDGNIVDPYIASDVIGNNTSSVEPAVIADSNGNPAITDEKQEVLVDGDGVPLSTQTTQAPLSTFSTNPAVSTGTAQQPVQAPVVTPDEADVVEKPRKRRTKYEMRRDRRLAEKYNEEWFLNRAKELGMVEPDATSIDGFKYSPDNPDANLANFNNLYRNHQRQQALDTHVKGGRKAKENELFHPVTGLYRYSDDKSTIYKYDIADSDKDYYEDADGKVILKEEYDGLSDEDKGKYRKISVKAGDKIPDYYGNYKQTKYERTLDDLLNEYTYDDDFKWNPEDAGKLSYPVEMPHSRMSDLRYAPVFTNLVSLAYNLFNKGDYDRANAIINMANQYQPMLVSPEPVYSGYKYTPKDPWILANVSNAANAAAQRAILNSGATAGGAQAGLLAGARNLIEALGNNYQKINDYNDKMAIAKAEFDLKPQQINAANDLQAQIYNQNALWNAQQHRYNGLVAGNTMKNAIDAQRNAAINTNWSNLGTSLGNVGEEELTKDMLAWLERTGVLKSDVYSDSGSAKYGGMLTRRKKKGGKC